MSDAKFEPGREELVEQGTPESYNSIDQSNASNLNSNHTSIIQHTHAMDPVEVFKLGNPGKGCNSKMTKKDTAMTM